jgi:hypothetical protein
MECFILPSFTSLFIPSDLEIIGKDGSTRDRKLGKC